MVHKWQYRRVQNVMLGGIVLQSASVAQMAHEHPRRNKTIEHPASAVASEKRAQVSVSEEPNIAASQDDAGAVVFLFPPKGYLPWSLSSLWFACKLWLLETFNPVKDSSGNDKVRNFHFQ